MGVRKKDIGVAARFLTWISRMLVPDTEVQNSRCRQVWKETALVLDITGSEILREENRNVSVDHPE